MRFRLLKIVSWLVVAIVLSVAITVAVFRVLIFTTGEKGHSSVVTDTAIAVVQAQPDADVYFRGPQVRT
jgi:hypothetical protein